MQVLTEARKALDPLELELQAGDSCWLKPRFSSKAICAPNCLSPLSSSPLSIFGYVQFVCKLNTFYPLSNFTYLYIAPRSFLVSPKSWSLYWLLSLLDIKTISKSCPFSVGSDTELTLSQHPLLGYCTQYSASSCVGDFMASWLVFPAHCYSTANHPEKHYSGKARAQWWALV